jgi:hypothetical protein
MRPMLVDAAVAGFPRTSTFAIPFGGIHDNRRRVRPNSALETRSMDLVARLLGGQATVGAFGG